MATPGNLDRSGRGHMAVAAVGRGSAMDDLGLVTLPTGSSSRTQATETKFNWLPIQDASHSAFRGLARVAIG
jgi:hypothetical protein